MITAGNYQTFAMYINSYNFLFDSPIIIEFTTICRPQNTKHKTTQNSDSVLDKISYHFSSLIPRRLIATISFDIIVKFN